jgi:hypothetical protein
MKFRDVVIFSGKKFAVPQGIQRIDTRATHGWQVRYGGTKLFSDHTSDGSGAQASLDLAKAELARRIAKMPAPSLLQKKPSESKTSNLPVGISGPIVRQRQGSNVRSCSFSVLLPQFGAAPRCSSVYIGTENTYTVERYHAALEKAVAMRQGAELVYEQATTRAKRSAAKALMGPAPVARKTSAKTAAKPAATPAAKKPAKQAAKAPMKAVRKASTRTTAVSAPAAKTRAKSARPAVARTAVKTAARAAAR